MTARRELLEQLLVERFQPVPRPVTRTPVDDEKPWQRLRVLHKATQPVRDTDPHDRRDEEAAS